MRWIKCSDSLPENDEDVLVYNYKDGIGIGYFESDKVQGYYEKDGSYFVTNNGWNVSYEWAPHSGPSHWMPLPPSPDSIEENECAFQMPFRTVLKKKRP